MSLQMLIIHELTKRSIRRELTKCSIRREKILNNPIIDSYEDDELIIPTGYIKKPPIDYIKKPPTDYIKKPPILQMLIICELSKRIYRANNNTHTSLIYSRLDIIYDFYNK